MISHTLAIFEVSKEYVFECNNIGIGGFIVKSGF